jgi:hypothetical protein
VLPPPCFDRMDNLVSTPRVGEIVVAWHIRGSWELVAIVEERARMEHWWLVYRWYRGRWVLMGAFLSAGQLVLQAVGRYAEVVEVALPVDPQQTVRLVVEEDDRYLYWVVYGSLGYWTGILVVYSTYKEAYVVPI